MTHLSSQLTSVRLKLLAGAVVSSALFFIFMNQVTSNFVDATFSDEFQRHATKTAKLITMLAQGARRSDEAYLSAMLRKVRSSEGGEEIARIHIHRGMKGKMRVLASTLTSEIGKPLHTGEEAEAHNHAQMYRELNGIVEIHRPLRLGDDRDWLLGIYFLTKQRDRQVSLVTARTMPARGASLAVLLIAVYIVGEFFILRPIDRLRTSAIAIAAGDIDQEMTINRRDEIGTLAQSLEDMKVTLTTYASNLEHRLDELMLIHNISKVSGSTNDLEASLNVILESAVKAVGADRGAIYLKPRAKGLATGPLTLKVHYCPDKTRLTREIEKSEKSLADRVLQTGQPFMVTDARGDIPDDRYHDTVAVPIVIGGRSSGVLMVGGKRGSGFEETDMRLLSILANQSAGVINVAWLFEDLQASYLSTVQALAAAIDAKDRHTRGHSGRVVKYCQLVTKELGGTPDELEAIKIAAYLHDLGKIGIDERVLLKKESLTEAEREAIRQHPSLSAMIISRVSFMEHVVPLVRHHHERYDGTGYPDGLAGEEIPLGARIMAVADAFDAMTSDRPYRKALSTKQAVEQLIDGSGSQFDPRIVTAFLKVLKADVCRLDGGWGDELVKGSESA